LSDICNDEKNLNQISFVWSPVQTAILSLRVGLNVFLALSHMTL